MKSSEIYAAPRVVSDIEDCFFYHTIDLPEYGTQQGLFDLRSGAQAYLGHVPVSGKRVLEVGTANGFLCFHMEQQGAEVVAYDLSDGTEWDIVPYANADTFAKLAERADIIGKLNNAFWLAHRLYQSQARVVYGTIYTIPETIGAVDIVTFGAILLHVRDPFLALQNALKMTRETVIITELIPVWQRFLLRYLPIRKPVFAMMRSWHTLATRLWQPKLAFLPNYRRGDPYETWWQLSPQILQAFLGVLGFEDTQISYHMQSYRGKLVPLYTIVGNRTSDKVI
ncbi:class I SAM-dependent methyltransferase [Chloroflexota bacterium]